MGGWLFGRLAAACREKEKEGWNFARARLHPPQPSPRLDAEGSWTAHMRCQFCARPAPCRYQPIRDLCPKCSLSDHNRTDALSAAIFPPLSSVAILRLYLLFLSDVRSVKKVFR